MAGEWCAAASAMGVDLASFAPTVAYGTHFITLEDLRSTVQKNHDTYGVATKQWILQKLCHKAEHPFYRITKQRLR
jgi:hypothetical protein